MQISNPNPQASWVPHSERLSRRVGLRFPLLGLSRFCSAAPSGRHLGLPLPPTQKITAIIPNAVREVRTAAPFHAFCGKNPTSIPRHGSISRHLGGDPSLPSIPITRELLPTPLRFSNRDQSMIAAAKKTRATPSPIGARFIVLPASPRAVSRRSLRVLCGPNSVPSVLKPLSSRTHKPPSRASLKLSCSGRTLDRPVPSPKNNPVIPNAVREVRTSAPSRAFCGKNPSSIQPTPFNVSGTPACPLGFLPCETNVKRTAKISPVLP
jgi:hypothetical protein